MKDHLWSRTKPRAVSRESLLRRPHRAAYIPAYDAGPARLRGTWFFTGPFGMFAYARNVTDSQGDSLVLRARYGPRAQDMWRWVDDPADEAVTAFVAQWLRLGPAERARTRRSLSEEDQGTLLAYAQRSVFAALRREDPALVPDAVAAMSLVSEDGIGDDRVIWTVAGLVGHAHGRLGGIDRAGVEAMLAGADRCVQAAFGDILDNGSDLEFDVGVREVRTRAGLVLLRDEGLPYEPNADLVDRAYDVAELLERDRYHVENIIIATEFMVYAADDRGDHVNPLAVEAAKRKVATVCAEAVIDDGPFQPLSAYLVEFASADDAALVAAASDRRDWPDEIQLAVAAGPRCAVLRLDVRDDDEPFIETVDSLERFRDGLLAVIREKAGTQID